MPLRLAVHRVELARQSCPTRLPFRFGAVTVTRADLLTCRVHCVGSDGQTLLGHAADLLVPRWFRKDVARSPQADADALVASATAAARACVARGDRAQTPFQLWWEVFQECVPVAAAGAPDQLERGFGVALVERAVLDAACRGVGLPMAAALRQDGFGFAPAQVDPALTDVDLARLLPQPAPGIALRHTVGMLDPLRPEEVADAPDDGLPRCLRDDIAAYGLRWFKVKVGAGAAADRARLLDLAHLLEELDVVPELTLDGNEQFAELEPLAELLEAVAADAAGRRLLRRLHCIEQPLPRHATLDPDRHRALPRVQAFAPLMLDEADDRPDSFPRAVALGYRGVSVKNCKGVFRALCNFVRCARDPRLFQSGEDLTNLPLLPLQQDLATAACLGLPHVERNGHHYFRGLDHLAPPRQRAALAAHPDLYRPLGDGAALRIVDGTLCLSSVLAARGFGCELTGHADGYAVVAGA